MRCLVSRLFLKLLVLLCIPAVQACGLFSDSESGSHDGKPQMELSVQFQEVHRCSFMSPEIRVINPPKGTTLYDVELVEKKGSQENVLGKGSWHEDGSGIIPEGALTGHYKGPCPATGAKTEYFFMVSAKNGKDPKPLAISLYSFVLE